jgi:hypothetical protein
MKCGMGLVTAFDQVFHLYSVDTENPWDMVLERCDVGYLGLDQVR